MREFRLLWRHSGILPKPTFIDHRAGGRGGRPLVEITSVPLLKDRKAPAIHQELEEIASEQPLLDQAQRDRHHCHFRERKPHSSEPGARPLARGGPGNQTFAPSAWWFALTPTTDVRCWQIVLQKSKVAGLRFFRVNTKREAIADSYDLNRVAEVACEFDVRR
jgi:hypothetical protein